MSEIIIKEFNQKYNELCETIDDAIEEGDFSKVQRLINSLIFSKTTPGCVNDILKACMDTAYRGTKVQPPVKECFEMVEYFKLKGIPVPTYEFCAKKIN